jgi:hypothetical protein
MSVPNPAPSSPYLATAPVIRPEVASSTLHVLIASLLRAAGFDAADGDVILEIERMTLERAYGLVPLNSRADGCRRIDKAHDASPCPSQLTVLPPPVLCGIAEGSTQYAALANRTHVAPQDILLASLDEGLDVRALKSVVAASRQEPASVSCGPVVLSDPSLTIERSLMLFLSPALRSAPPTISHLLHLPPLRPPHRLLLPLL